MASSELGVRKPEVAIVVLVGTGKLSKFAMEIKFRWSRVCFFPGVRDGPYIGTGAEL